MVYLVFYIYAYRTYNNQMAANERIEIMNLSYGRSYLVKIF